MPGFDSTGPEGRGPYGRGLGPCGEGRGHHPRGFFGFGRGRGWGGRGLWWVRRPVVDVKTDLEAERTWLEEQLAVINRRLDEIKKE
jgi:hypothetical protein